MYLNGKKVAFLGDSITEGVGVSSPFYSYTEVFSRITGAIVTNLGISGTRIARQKTPSPEPRWDLCFLDRVDDIPLDTDLVVVFGGTNDFGHGDAEFGRFQDRDEYTFYGALYSLFCRIINRLPDARVVIMTPLHRLTEDYEINEYGKPRHLLIDYVEAIRKVAQYYSVPVLDLYSSCGLQPANSVIKERYMPDGLHPNNRGAERIATILADFVKYV